MNTSSDLSIFGADTCSFTEDIADLFLCVANSLDKKRSVAVVQDGRTYKVCYDYHGSLGQIFDNAIENSSNWYYGLSMPFLAATTCAFAFTYLATLPFFAFGTLIKVGVLETNSKANAYNRLVANHLENIRDCPLDFVLAFNKSYRSLAQAEALYDLLVEKTKDKSKKTIQTKLQVLPEGEIDLFIHLSAGYGDNCFDYDFEGPKDSFLSKRIAMGTLNAEITNYKSKLAEIEKMEQLQKEFISNVEKLLMKEKQD